MARTGSGGGEEPAVIANFSGSTVEEYVRGHCGRPGMPMKIRYNSRIVNVFSISGRFFANGV
jgi:hypothetical protein